MSDPETIEEFTRRWAVEHTEWTLIRDEMIAGGAQPSAYDVTAEQRRRMTERGEVSVLDGVFARRLINRKLAKVES